jgi:hypothetical protein
VILTKAGEESQVDYGTGPMVRDPHSGKYRRTRLFVLTLGFSRKSVRLLALPSGCRQLVARTLQDMKYLFATTLIAAIQT